MKTSDPRSPLDEFVNPNRKKKKSKTFKGLTGKQLEIDYDYFSNDNDGPV